MSTLLEKALKAKVLRRRVKPPSREEVALAVAYFHGEVSARQVAAALGVTRQGSSTWSAVALRSAVINGLVTLKVTP